MAIIGDVISRTVTAYQLAGGEIPTLDLVVPISEAARSILMTTFSDPAPTWLSGHEPGGAPTSEPHLAVAVIGRCLILAPPADLELPDIAGRQLGLALRGERWRLERSTPPDVIGPARAWQTATPVVFDRFPKRGDLEREAARCLENAGIFGPKVEVQSTARSRELGRSLLMPVFDVRFSLPYELTGPVFAGRMRHKGLGIFIPVAG